MRGMLAISIILAVLLISCEKEKIEIEHNNKSFGFEIDGKVFQPSCPKIKAKSGFYFNWGISSSRCIPYEIDYSSDINMIEIRARSEREQKRIRLWHRWNTKAENSLFTRNAVYHDLNVKDNCGRYYLDTTYINFISKSKRDTIQKTISGYFGFRAVRSDCDCDPDTVTIKYGYYNAPYYR